MEFKALPSQAEKIKELHVISKIFIISLSPPGERGGVRGLKIISF